MVARVMAAVAAALFLGGCATYVGSSRPTGPDELASPGWLAVRSVPYIAQREDKDCGVASLAMVLVYLKAAEGIDDARAQVVGPRTRSAEAGGPVIGAPVS